MANLDGESTAEIGAALEDVWALVQDVERAPDWQGGLKSLTAVQHDEDGRVVLADIEIDGKFRTLKARMRFTWELVDLGETTRARYHTEVDLGRLGLFIRGPLVGPLRDQLAGARASELKREAERGA